MPNAAEPRPARCSPLPQPPRLNLHIGSPNPSPKAAPPPSTSYGKMGRDLLLN